MTTTINLGDRFTIVFIAPWNSPVRPGVERTIAAIEVVEVRPGGFNYKVTEVIEVTDAMPLHPNGSTRVGDPGGMTFDYAELLMADGDLLPYDPANIPELPPVTQAPVVIDPADIPAQWERQFGKEYDVPALFTQHPDLYDTSWRNDTSPSFTLAQFADNDVEEQPRLVVEHPEQDKREAGGDRFVVFTAGADDDEEHYPMMVYSGDDAQDALDALLALRREPAVVPDGWEGYHTGGGCTAFKKDLSPELRALICSEANEAQWPKYADERVDLCIDTEGGTLLFCSCRNIAHALDIIDSIVSVEVDDVHIDLRKQ